MRVAKTRGTVQLLTPTIAPSGKNIAKIHVPDGALLAPPMDNVPHEKWPADLRAHYEQALKNAEGAKLYQHGAGAGVGLEHRPVVQFLQDNGGLAPQEALDLARFRQHKQGIAPRTGPTEQLDTPQDVMARAAAMRSAKSPEERNKIEQDARAREDMLRQEHYFDELVGPKKRAQQQPVVAPSGPPVSQAEPIAAPTVAPEAG